MRRACRRKMRTVAVRVFHMCAKGFSISAVNLSLSLTTSGYLRRSLDKSRRPLCAVVSVYTRK